MVAAIKVISNGGMDCVFFEKKREYTVFLFNFQYISSVPFALFHPYFHDLVFYMHGNPFLCIDLVLLSIATTYTQHRGADVTISVLVTSAIAQIMNQNCQVLSHIHRSCCNSCLESCWPPEYKDVELIARVSLNNWY